MGEDMTSAEVDWVAVMFHAAKQIGAENKQLRQQVQAYEEAMSRQLAERNELYLLVQPIKEMYEEHPGPKSSSLGQIIEEMVKLWEDDNIPF